MGTYVLFRSSLLNILCFASLHLPASFAAGQAGLAHAEARLARHVRHLPRPGVLAERVSPSVRDEEDYTKATTYGKYHKKIRTAV